MNRRKPTQRRGQAPRPATAKRTIRVDAALWKDFRAVVVAGDQCPVAVLALILDTYVQLITDNDRLRMQGFDFDQDGNCKGRSRARTSS